MLAVTGFVAGCNCCNNKSTTKTASVDSPKMMCTVKKDEEADAKVTYMYNGKTYHFCCKDCIDEFKKSPEKFTAAK
jgi:YHS domain-containing protein